MRNSIHFLLNGNPVRIDPGPDLPWSPTTTVLQYLRDSPEHRGVKEGCAEGDCGACTVVVAEEATDGTLQYRAVDSCLLFLPSLDRKQLITIEGLRSSDGALHPVQEQLLSSQLAGRESLGFVVGIDQDGDRLEGRVEVLPARPEGPATKREASKTKREASHR